MLDRAFAMGYGRTLEQDRAAAVETYLKVIARAPGDDETATRIRQSALRGLLAMLDAIVERKDHEAGRRVMPALESGASTAAGIQYYLGLMNECVAQPANLEAARQWYRKAAADAAWKQTADDKLRVIGAWCPAAT
jgi:TPR repeat protein